MGENENYYTGGTGAALFSAEGPQKVKTKAQNLGDDYVPPVGLPEWKQPSFDDDDNVHNESILNKAPTSKFIFIKNELKVAKIFYFFFFGAFGSLFPMMSIYFKGLGMDAAQCGLLVGVRPIIEYLATPFWHGMSDRFQAGKVLLLMSVASWVLFTLPIGFIHPPVVSCKHNNGSHYLLKDPSYMEKISKRDVSAVLEDNSIFAPEPVYALEGPLVRQKRSDYDDAQKWSPGYVVGTSPQIIHFDDYYKNTQKGRQDKYGSQRMFGSIGWGVCMFVMGIVLDNSTIFPTHRCELSRGERNYNVCYYMFSFMMLVAFLVATQIPFRYTGSKPDDIAMQNVNTNYDNSKKAPNKTSEEKLKDQAKKIKYFAKELQTMPEFAAVFKAFSNIRLMLFMLVAWVMGIGIGLIFTFLFWHLQDYGGHPTIFGIASVINHLSEMGAYFYSFKIISQYGHVKVLIAGLAGNVVRFLYIYWISEPWLVLPFEFIQGITHAAVWAACCSFIAHNTDEALRPSAQGVLQGIHHGFGRFCGAVFGGMLIKNYGTGLIFLSYALVCAVVLVIFLIFNFYNISEGKFSTELGEDVDPRNVMKGDYLEPHGIPLSGYKLKSRRNSETEPMNQAAPEQQENLNPFLDASQQQYSTTGAAAGDGTDGQYYGRGYSQAQSGYSSSGLGY
ncbi:major facilitator superfamily domain-containing protein 6 [Eurytemora carolleeae]|uniref:major facilitator superfamily domain-containing protein 6 n=1 Tax=Eurytemora carolleeae TaxID=1294199 RepID=UPI000C787F94|nr:major facilitator superfamily domain-containing protein 6 [Eurytemora carolleeae]|eukprot:XP_023322863.1 major facilitator superfamily domain-containing protein 6-like [Eurytemora affinis]